MNLIIENAQEVSSYVTQEIKMFIDNDKETQDLRLELKNLKSLAEVTEKQMKNIELARWDAKNLIEYMKLKSGIL